MDSIAGISYYLNKLLDAIIVSFITILSFSKSVRPVHLMHSTQFNSCSAKLPTSFLVSYDLITVQSLTPLTMRLRESYNSASMSCR